ncbi:predicted protein [Chaetomium globosum CBS 148.51]|uniref:Uncharacterized protein n=1 Tax=Chaetomium globosum (strain ATCC 6205 / CBS 148.51 / DSM 1962 / NBRC 6347 / NRRL 1970) TaxID=306901 RepID=Q2GP35_CHAGB|nr:uncharacterized protein CHGG_10269 [Chaetomium globosum CBS 148.51]EAQ83865.1 predicted protein [Chaetomium globosum CBS 148.51]
MTKRKDDRVVGGSARRDRFVMIEDGMLKRDPLRAVVFDFLCSCAARWQMWRTTQPRCWERVMMCSIVGWSIILSSRSGVVVIMECSLQMPDRALTTYRHPPLPRPIAAILRMRCSYSVRLPVVPLSHF